MKKLLFACLTAITLTSCGVGSALILNQNQNATQVQLGSNNFKVVGRATGSSEVKYILLIGGLKKRQIYENAYSDMMNHADLQGGSRALVNIVSEEYGGGVPPFYFKRKITVSASVIEFTK